MRRPCADTHPEPVTSGCHLCRLFLTDAGYRRLWGTTAAPLSRSLPCVHEGAVLHPCPAGHESLHVRECREEYGRTTRDRCRSCADYDPAGGVVVRTAGMGIGDMVSQLFACVGLAVQGDAVTMRCRHDPGWLSGVSHPGLTFTTHADDGHDCNRDYGTQMAMAAANTGTRVGWYCDNLSAAVGVPKFAPARPTVVKPDPVRLPGYAVISPFSDDAERCWPAERWRALANGLLAAGWDVVGVDKPDGMGRLAAVFAGIHGVELRAGEQPTKAAAVVANAGLFVGNDSGMAHMAGLYGVPGAVVMTHFPFGFVFGGGVYPSLQGFGRHRGLMTDVTADEVVAWAKRWSPLRGEPDLFGLIRKHLGQRAITTEWLFREIAARWPSPRVVETGCVRSPEDWSAGYFGWLCGAFLDWHGGGGLVSVDIDATNCRTARGLCHRWRRAVAVESDSVRYLGARTEPVDLAYVDSMDTDLPGHAEHGLAEAQAVEPLMSERGLIVFDDTPLGGDGWGGKGAKAIPWLLSRGWEVRPESGYQAVMERRQ